MKKILLTESDKKHILTEREQAIIDKFAQTFNSIKRIDENEVNEINFKNLAAGAMMGLGALAGGKAQAQDVPKNPQTEIPAKKSMYGSPEERAAAKAKKMATRKANEDNMIKGAIMANLYKPIGDNEYNAGLNDAENNALEFKDIAYSMLPDGTPVKVNLKKYRKLIADRQSMPDIAKTYGAETCKVGKDGERISEPGDTETNRKHCTGSAEGHRQRKAIETGEKKS
jgi:hypothetical protein